MFDFHNIKNLIYCGVLVYALVYGVNWNGRHYGLDFSRNGISLINGVPVHNK